MHDQKIDARADEKQGIFSQCVVNKIDHFSIHQMHHFHVLSRL